MGDVPRVEYGSRNYQDVSSPKPKKETDKLIYDLMKDSKIDQKEIEKKVVEFLDKYRNHENFPKIKGELLLELQKEIKDRRKKLESFRKKNDISNINEIADQINKLDVIANTVRKIVLEQDKSAMKDAKDISFAVSQPKTMSGTIGTDEASDKINGAWILQDEIITTVSQSVGNEAIDSNSYWTYSVGADKNLGHAKKLISENLKQAGITDYGIQQILQKFEKSVTKISQTNAGPAIGKINGASSNEAKKEALVNALKGIYKDALNAISGDIKSIKNNHASASKPEGLTNTEKQETEKYKSTFCYHGGPLPKGDSKLKELVMYRVVIISTGNKNGQWKKSDIENLKAEAKIQGNKDIQVLSYVSLGAADDDDRTAFELELKKKYPDKTFKPEDIWMNPERKKGSVTGARINFSNPDVKTAWIKFKKEQIEKALAENPGGGVFWDDSDVIQIYLDKRNDAKNDSDKEKWQNTVNDFTDLYKSACEQIRTINPKATIYQNRGDLMRDPNSYKVKNSGGWWVNDTDDSAGKNSGVKNEYYSSKTNEALKSNSSVTFENIQKGEEFAWKNRIINSLVDESPRFINIINYYNAESGKQPSILPEETQKLIKECCEEAAMARKEMGLRQLSIADLQKFITVQYYDGPALPMIAEQIFPPPQR